MTELDSIYQRLLPTLDELEQARVAYLRRKAIFLPIAILLPVAGLGFGLMAKLGLFIFFLAIILGGIGGVIYHFNAGKLGSAYIERYKSTVLPALVSMVDPQLKFQGSGGIPKGSFIDSELFSTRPDRYNTEDLIHGYHGKTFLQLAEIHAEDERQRTDSDGKTETYYVTIFKGVLLIADFNKHFHGRTFIFPDAAEKMFGAFGRAFQKMGGRQGTDLIQLEDPEFEKAFVVHSTDQVESRYILSSAMMRRFLDVRARFGKDVRAAFKDSCLYLAVPHSHPYLEPKSSVAATERTQVQGMMEEMRMFLDVIEVLDLNTRIWTKE